MIHFMQTIVMAILLWLFKKTFWFNNPETSKVKAKYVSFIWNKFYLDLVVIGGDNQPDGLLNSADIISSSGVCNPSNPRVVPPLVQKTAGGEISFNEISFKWLRMSMKV